MLQFLQLSLESTFYSLNTHVSRVILANIHHWQIWCARLYEEGLQIGQQAKVALSAYSCDTLLITISSNSVTKASACCAGRQQPIIQAVNILATYSEHSHEIIVPIRSKNLTRDASNRVVQVDPAVQQIAPSYLKKKCFIVCQMAWFFCLYCIEIAVVYCLTPVI